MDSIWRLAQRGRPAGRGGRHGLLRSAGSCAASAGGNDGDIVRGTAQRNIAAALVVANQSFDDPNVVVMVIVVAIVGLLALIPLAAAS